MKVAIRADASNQIGSGHVMRCATLAGLLRERGAEVTFVCRELDGNYCDWIETQGFAVLRLPAPGAGEITDHKLDHARWLGVTQARDSAETQRAMAGSSCDWLIVDHYAIDAEWETEMRRLARRILVIDDLADRRHAADLLLDQNLQSKPARYARWLPDTCSQLLGPTYALLRPEFSGLRTVAEVRSGGLNRLLVFMGGSDPNNVTLRVLQAVQRSGLGVVTDVVMGVAAPHLDVVREQCASMADCTLHVQTKDMAQLMAKADLMIGAPGSATWERCCVGLPSVLVAFAENQRDLGAQVACRRAAIYLGEADEVPDERLIRVLTKLIARPTLLRRMSQRAKQLADGHGAMRVASAVVGRLDISVLSDASSWINAYIPGLIEYWGAQGHRVRWVHDVSALASSDAAFFLGCSQMVPCDVLQRNAHNLVVHESALPEGRGWSPLTWQVLEGKNRIPITLFEAAEAVDSGPIFIQRELAFKGHELVEDLRRAQGEATVALCRDFVGSYPSIAADGRRQRGTASYYARRRPADSKLDPDKTLREQFNLLRVVDNDTYPAYFECEGHRYQLSIKCLGLVANEQPGQT